MTYEQYIEETRANCAKVLSDCSAGELLDVEYLRKILWEDDRVTGVISGYCTSVRGTAAENIEGVLFDSISVFSSLLNRNRKGVSKKIARHAETP